MNKKLRMIVIAIIVVVALGFGYLLFSSDKDTADTTAQKKSTTTQTSKAQPSNSESVEGGKYVEYSDAALASAQGQRILFFHAPWCPQCRELEDSIQSGSIPKDVTILKVDYDSNQELRQQYGVTIQTTVVLVDEQGNEVKKYVAYDEPSLQAIVDNLL